ncbi:hypothetical protein M0Q97_03530 [Candidatus Dojkabacteria bacterium]|jgi:hypothetical protein|nr:hypothetical protein [Candidatus Dojkabacteria bacterium]
MDNKKFLGEKSYPAIVDKIVEKIKNAQADTLEGNEFLKQMFQSLNESSTPIMNLKPFLTGAEKIANDDVKLKEVIDFCKKEILSGDLNFLINLVKEDHFKEMLRMYHPAPEQTIKDIEEKFNEPGSVIEQGIKAGLFDNLKSKLLGTIKKDLNIETKLNESKTMFKNSLISYNPIGIKTENKKTKEIVFLMENAIIDFDENKNMKSLKESEIEILPEERRLMSAINSLSYNPETSIFSLKENWDFNLQLNSDGNLFVNDKEIPKEKIKSLLFESINLYETTPPESIKNFNKQKYLIDADNFLMLTENINNLIKFDNLITIRNLNENTYVIFNSEDVFGITTPQLITSSTQYDTKLFESYGELVDSMNVTLKENISDLFLVQLKNEKSLLDERNNKIVNLNENLKEINIEIEKINKLKGFAEPNSPALIKLNESENKFQTLLDKTLNDLNFYKNEYKLY